MKEVGTGKIINKNQIPIRTKVEIELLQLQ
jgi:hypothetical protein